MKVIYDKAYSDISLTEINNRAKKQPFALVKYSEDAYFRQLVQVAELVRKGKQRFVLLAGPSASGKTTTAHKLKAQLLTMGIGAKVLSMDDFFKGIQQYKKLEDGTPDMESVENVDMDLLNRCFAELLEFGESKFPVFDFKAQARSSKTNHVTLAPAEVLIMEGIHALNPQILQNIDEKEVFRLYVSVRTNFVNNGEVALVPNELRLIRRMVRDYLFRGHSILDTINYWEIVLEGERQNINPYRDDVHFKMDNTLDYEACMWHTVLHKHIQTIDVLQLKEHPQIKHLLTGLAGFHKLDLSLVPQDSLLREFIGF